MVWYKIELNVGISDKLATYILTTYGNNGQNIRKFERTQNYTLIYAQAANITAINNALIDIRNRLAEVEEVAYVPDV